VDYAATYDRYWGEASRLQRRVQEGDREVADEIQRCLGLGSLLDVGCGEGRLVRRLCSLGFDAQGVDVSGVVVAEANRRCPDRILAANALHLPHEDATFDIVTCVHTLEHLEESDVPAAICELHRVSRDAVYLRIATTADSESLRQTIQTREWWETQCYAAGFRKHPRYLIASPFGSLDSKLDECTILLQKLPHQAGQKYSIADLQEERQLHMDMSREAGRRSDAHIVRYFEAAQCVRPGDRVLDAACGLGYGSTVITYNSRCASYTGIDFSSYAVEYASLNFAGQSQPVEFREGSLPDCLEPFDAGSFDFIASFETLEHLREPHLYLQECHRLLTPAGRLMISVPNDWAEADGIDPNPHHFHVYTWQKILRELEEAGFLVERTIAETVSRRKENGQWATYGFEWNEYDVEQVAHKPGEWCIVLAMKSPFDLGSAKFTNSAFCEVGESPSTHVMNFAEQYENPWLIPSIVTRGCRTERRKLREEIANRVLDRQVPDADEAASLCVLAYGMLGEGAQWDTIEQLLDRFEPHVAKQDWLAAEPIEVRWGVSLTYVGAMLALECGQRGLAVQLLEECIALPFLRYAPLLATKTISAALLRAKLALVDGDVEGAKSWLRQGAAAAELAVTQDWRATFGDLEHQPLPAFRELAEVLELGSQCIAGLTLLGNGSVTPGVYDMLAANKSTEIERLLTYQKSLGGAITWHQEQMRALHGGIEFWQSQTNVANHTIHELESRLQAQATQLHAMQLAASKQASNPIVKQYKKLRNSVLKRLGRQT
jgi:2-polyprenyl-3-methyl-5-hydroxy-6-metoxy-1,4-benzoquinol methylase